MHYIIFNCLLKNKKIRRFTQRIAWRNKSISELQFSINENKEWLDILSKYKVLPDFEQRLLIKRKDMRYEIDRRYKLMAARRLKTL